MRSWQGSRRLFLIPGLVAAMTLSAAAQEVTWPEGATEEREDAPVNPYHLEPPAPGASAPPRTILPEPGASQPILPDLGSQSFPPAGASPTDPPDLWRQLGPSGIEVETLKAAGPGSIGLLDETSGGFAPNLWAGSHPDTILNLLGMMPALEDQPALQGLLRRLLLTIAPPPGENSRINDEQELDFLLAKLDGLAAMGDLESIQGLLARVGRSVDDPRLTRHRVTSELLAGNYAAACDAASGGISGDAAVEWLRIAAFCRHLNDDTAGASLALEMLREQEDRDPAFMALMAAALRGGTAEIEGPLAPSPVVLALAHMTRTPLTEIDIAETDPLVLARIAGLPHLAISERAAAARVVAARGGLAPERLAQIYTAMRFAPEQFEHMELRLDDMPPAAAEALVLQAALSAAEPARRAEIVSLGLRRARAVGAEGLYAGFMAPVLAQLQPDVAIESFAGDAMRLALLAGRPDDAQDWYRFLRDAAQMGDTRAASALTELWPLIMVGAPMVEVDYTPDNLEAWWTRRQQIEDPTGEALALTLFTVLEAEGYVVPEYLWSSLMTSPAAAQGSAPNLSIWRGLRQASSAGRVGETALLAVVSAGGAPATPVVVSGVARALTAVGLDREARAIAIAALIRLGL